MPSEAPYPNVAPVFDSMQSAEVKLVSMSQPCSESTRPDTRSTPMYVKTNTVMFDTTGAEIEFLPVM